MAYKELVDYVKNTRGMGYSDDLIFKTLMSRGWTRSDIAQAFEQVDNPPVGQSTAQGSGRPGVFSKTPPQEAGKSEMSPTTSQTADSSPRRFSSIAAWFSCIAHPASTLRAAKYFASVGKALFSLVLPFIMVAIAVAIGAVLFASQIAQLLPANLQSLIVSVSSVLLVGLTLAGIAASVLQAILFNALAWLFSKFVSGKGTFVEQLYLSSIAWGAAFILLVLGGMLLLVSSFLPSSAVPPFYIGDQAITVFNLIAAIYFVIVVIYSVLLQIYAISRAHEFGLLKSFSSVLFAAVVISLLGGAVALYAGIAGMVLQAVHL